MADPADVRYDFLKHVHVYLQDTLKQADQKAVASMAMSLAMLGVSLTGQSFRVFTVGRPDAPEFFLGLASYILLLAAFGSGIFVIFPRIVHNPPKGWIFWESIAGYTIDEFPASLEAAGPQDIFKALALDTYIKSRIIAQKLVWLRVSVYAGSVGTILAAATLLMKK